MLSRFVLLVQSLYAAKEDDLRRFVKSLSLLPITQFEPDDRIQLSITERWVGPDDVSNILRKYPGIESDYNNNLFYQMVRFLEDTPCVSDTTLVKLSKKIYGNWLDLPTRADACNNLLECTCLPVCYESPLWFEVYGLRDEDYQHFTDKKRKKVCCKSIRGLRNSFKRLFRKKEPSTECHPLTKATEEPSSSGDLERDVQSIIPSYQRYLPSFTSHASMEEQGPSSADLESQQGACSTPSRIGISLTLQDKAMLLAGNAVVKDVWESENALEFFDQMYSMGLSESGIDRKDLVRYFFTTVGQLKSPLSPTQRAKDFFK